MLLLVITQKLDQLKLDLQQQIRQFYSDDAERDPRSLDLEVSGFWNFMLEVVFNFYIVVCYAISITLIASLAIVFYPLNAVLRVFASLFRNTQGGLFLQHDIVAPEKIESAQEADPVIIKNTNKS